MVKGFTIRGMEGPMIKQTSHAKNVREILEKQVSLVNGNRADDADINSRYVQRLEEYRKSVVDCDPPSSFLKMLAFLSRKAKKA